MTPAHTLVPLAWADNHPNTQLFPDFANNGTGWFDWLMSKGLRTYFNDHRKPRGGGPVAVLC